ncbi:MAG: OmpA family protein [Planktomarina sp.]
MYKFVLICLALLPNLAFGQTADDALPSSVKVAPHQTTGLDDDTKAQLIAASAFIKAAEPAVYFAPLSSDLDNAAKSVLMDQAKFMQQHPAYHFTLWGHADVASEKGQGNLLSQARVNTVHAYLLDQGVDPAQLTRKPARGFRDSWPGMDPALRRRVVTELTMAEIVE